MNRSRSRADKPPLCKANSAVTPTVSTPVRRGRPSRSDYLRQVIPLIRSDLWTLEECSLFSTLPGVRTLLSQNEREVLPLGVSLKRLFDKAVEDVISLGSSVTGHQIERITTFLYQWYVEEKPVTEVARSLELERTHVVKTVQRPALELVARRFLLLAEQDNPLQANPANIGEFRRIVA